METQTIIRQIDPKEIQGAWGAVEAWGKSNGKTPLETHGIFFAALHFFAELYGIKNPQIHETVGQGDA